MQAQGGGGEQGWLRLAGKLEYYCCSSYYVTHPNKGYLLQNPVVIINNHLPLAVWCKIDYSRLLFIYYFIINTSVVHNIMIVNKSTLGQFSYNVCLILNSFLKVFLYFRTFKPNCWEHCATLFSDQINNIIIYQEKLYNSCFFVNCSL